MKNQILSMSVMALLAVGLTFTGCKKTDTNAPTIALVGPATVDLKIGDAYTDQGATAEDKEDGNLTDKITSNAKDVDTKKAASYTITYTVSDAAGNEATAKRIVNVRNSAAAYEGLYTATQIYVSDPTTPYTYTDTVVASTTVNGELYLTRLNDINKLKVKIVVNEAAKTITIPADQVFLNAGKSLVKFTINPGASSSGTIASTTAPIKFSALYKEQKESNAAVDATISYTHK